MATIYLLGWRSFSRYYRVYQNFSVSHSFIFLLSNNSRSPLYISHAPALCEFYSIALPHGSVWKVVAGRPFMGYYGHAPWLACPCRSSWPVETRGRHDRGTTTHLSPQVRNCPIRLEHHMCFFNHIFRSLPTLGHETVHRLSPSFFFSKGSFWWWIELLNPFRTALPMCGQNTWN